MLVSSCTIKPFKLTIMKNILTACATAALLVFATSGLKAQESFGNAGLEVVVPVGDWADMFGVGIGGSGGMEFGVSDNFAVTANVGIAFLTLDDEVSDFISSAWLAPIQVGGRFYLDQQRSGLFLEAKAGVLFRGLSAEGGDSETETNFSFAPQVGYFINENLSIALRYNLFLIPEDEEFGVEAETAGFVGLKVAFNF